MRFTMKNVIMILAAVLGFVGMATAQVMPDKFDGRCKYVTLGGHGRKGATTLEATCRDDANVPWKTVLNLNNCIGNGVGDNAGKLEYRNK
jgi:hypothetical protein